MATSSEKTLCAICERNRGVFKCDGCSYSFCIQHTTDHRQAVIKQLNEVEKARDSIQEVLTKKSTESQQHLKNLRDELTKKIDQWENDSILKIKAVAQETRDALTKHTINHLTHKKLELDELTNELRLGGENLDFIETDLRTWMDRLNKLKDEITKPGKIAVRESSLPLINKIHLDIVEAFEVFERTSGKAIFEDNGRVVVVQESSVYYSEVRGKNEYTTGRHTLVFKLEKLNGWNLFGIISKRDPLQEHSYNSPSCYGWYNGDQFVYRNGENVGGQGHDAIENDVIKLVIDCDQRSIQLTNERTNRTIELFVDINKCPFPWQLHLNLNLPPTRIRILS